MEMNGDWFPWSGWYYGADDELEKTPNEWEGPEHFKKAYRHVVDRVRARGADKYQMDVSHQQLFLSARYLEFRAGILSGFRLRGLAWVERVRPAIQRRAMGGYSITR